MGQGLFLRVAKSLLGRPHEVESDTGHDAETAMAIGLEHYGARRLGEASTAFERALRIDRHHAEAAFMAGVVSHDLGDTDSAISLLIRAIEIDPHHLRGHANLGVLHLAKGDLDSAEAALREAIQISPTFDQPYATLGLVLRARGDLVGAESALRHALRISPQDVGLLNNLGSLCKDLGRFQDAHEYFRQAAAIRPNSATIWENFGALAIASQDWQGACDRFGSATVADPGSAGAWTNLGYALGRLRKLVEAEAACRRALEIRPAWAAALVNLASVLKMQGDAAGAEAICRRAIAIDDDLSSAHETLGAVLQSRGAVTEALIHQQRAVDLDPGSATARYNLATTQLLLGNYREGFDLLESRFAAFPFGYNDGWSALLNGDHVKRWRGGGLDGRSLLLWAEQGLGDTLMMLRYLKHWEPLTKGKVIVACDDSLLRLVQGVNESFRVVAMDSSIDLPEYDLHCPLFSLPLLVGQDATAGTHNGPYISLPGQADVREPRSTTGGRKRVGVAWAGNPALRDDALRSVAISEFAPLWAEGGVLWVSLQKGDAASRVCDWPVPIDSPLEGCRDFLDTAAVVAGLDLVISVDTSVAHLAGAMGKVVWLLNRAGSEWRWGLHGDGTLWYPSMRIFRQHRPMEWQPTMAAVSTALGEFVRES